MILSTCGDDDEKVKNKDKFSHIHDNTHWLQDDYDDEEYGFYVDKDYVLFYFDYYGGGINAADYDYCMKIPLKAGEYSDWYGEKYLLDVLKNKGDTLLLQFVYGVNADDAYFDSGEMELVVTGSILRMNYYYIEEDGSFDKEFFGSWIKSDGEVTDC